MMPGYDNRLLAFIARQTKNLLIMIKCNDFCSILLKFVTTEKHKGNTIQHEGYTYDPVSVSWTGLSSLAWISSHPPHLLGSVPESITIIHINFIPSSASSGLSAWININNTNKINVWKILVWPGQQSPMQIFCDLYLGDPPLRIAVGVIGFDNLFQYFCIISTHFIQYVPDS